MKKILLSSIVLTAFALSMILFQISCKKEATAEIKPNDTPTSLGIVVYATRDNSDNEEIWKVNIDGTGKAKINITLPKDVEFQLSDGGSVKLTRDGKKIVFLAENNSTNKDLLFTCNIDGSNVTQIVDGGSLELGDVN